MFGVYLKQKIVVYYWYNLYTYPSLHTVYIGIIVIYIFANTYLKWFKKTVPSRFSSFENLFGEMLRELGTIYISIEVNVIKFLSDVVQF